MGLTNQKELVKRLRDCDRSDSGKVGGKNANLGEMIKSDYPVPGGFAITTDAYREVVTKSAIPEKIQKALSGLVLKDTESIDKASLYLRGLIEAQDMPQEIEQQVRQYYEDLCIEYDAKDIPVAVRSSATAEDLPDASFAGQHDTYLSIKKDSLIPAIKKCWSSLFTARAIGYRIRMGYPHEKELISVGVQKMVDAKAAGVMFTLNPGNGDRSKIMIGANWGLGQTVVDGFVNPDEWMIDKVVFEIIKRTVSTKVTEFVAEQESGKVIRADIPPDRQCVPCLNDEEIIELSKRGKEIEQHYNLPQDIEWAIDRHSPFPQNVFILQTRPETVWSQKKQDAKLETTGSSTGDVIEFWRTIKA